MDYLQEMARRQQAALMRLLTGGRSREETAAEEEQSRTRERPGKEGESGKAVRGNGDAAEAAAETAEQNRLGPGESARETVRVDGEADLLWQAEQFQKTRQADAVWRDNPGIAGSLPGILMRSGGHPAAEAEEISRAVQRDARRYDGGFTMF